MYSLLVAVCFAILVPGSASAHKVFEKELEKQYKGTINASCNTCHVAKKEKTVRNKFGDLFAKEFKGKDFSKKWNEMERDDQKVYEKSDMIPAFQKALKKIKAMKPEKSEETYDQLIATFKLDGIKEKKKKKK